MYKLFAIILMVLVFESVCERPCGSEPADAACVRNELSKRGGCTPISNSPDLDPLIVPEIYLILAAFNFTAVKTNSVFDGLNNTYVKDLVLDYDNNVTILVLNHTKYDNYGPIEFLFHWSGHADIVVNTTYNETLHGVITTTKFAGTDNLNLRNGQTWFELSEVLNLSFGDEFTQAAEEYDLVNKVVSALNTEPYVLAQEVFINISQIIAKDYVNKNVCFLE